MLFTILLQKLFQARPRYQKQRRHGTNHKTNPPTGDVRHTLAGQFTRTLDVLGGASALHCLKIC